MDARDKFSQSREHFVKTSLNINIRSVSYLLWAQFKYKEILSEYLFSIGLKTIDTLSPRRAVPVMKTDQVTWSFDQVNLII